MNRSTPSSGFLCWGLSQQSGLPIVGACSEAYSPTSAAPSALPFTDVRVELIFPKPEPRPYIDPVFCVRCGEPFITEDENDFLKYLMVDCARLSGAR